MKRALVCGVLGGSLLAGAAATATAIPWPGGRAPSAEAIHEMATAAGDRFEKDRFSEYFGALEDQLDTEVANFDQSLLDARAADALVAEDYGRRVFDLSFSRRRGRGGVWPSDRIKRVHDGQRGGLDTHSCAGCHSLGGRDGAGAATETAYTEGDGARASSAEARNPPALLGLGLIQALGAEMTADLQKQRDDALQRTSDAKAEIAVELSTKGIGFGKLVARADGSLDTSGVSGISTDLVVRPFGWKGTEARLRRMVEEAARIHMGIQTSVLAAHHREHPDPARLGDGKEWFDPDGDGVQRELEEGTLTSAAIYLERLETPVILPPSSPDLVARWASGQALFTSVGCAGCHAPELKLVNRLWREAPDTTRGEPIEVNLLRDGDQPRGNDRVQLYSDLKRHDMGPELADHRDSSGGLSRRAFLTRPLWGLAETAPYLHDGRAATIPDAILAHGGEAQAARDAFSRLSDGEKADLHVFLLSLTRTPKPRIPM